MKISLVGLRTRFTFAILLVQALLLVLLAVNGGRLMDKAVRDQFDRRIGDIGQLLATAIAVPLVQRDLAAIRELVAESAKDGELAYLYVRDRTGNTVASFGAMRNGEDVLQHKAPVAMAGQSYGELEFGLRTEQIRQAHHTVMLQSAALAVVAIIASLFFLLLAGRWLSNRLQALAEASERIADGEYESRLPLQGDAAIDRLTTAFNRMSGAVQEQVRQLEDSEARAEAIADYTYALEFWLSPEGKLLWINPSIERMFGYSVAECMGMPDFPLTLVHPDERAAAEVQLREALHGIYESGFIFRAYTKDGRTFWAVANWLSIYNKQADYLGLRASVHNIDAQKRSEEKLRQTVMDLRLSESLQMRYLDESEEERARLVALLSAMNLGILFVGADGRVIYYNPAFISMWGLDESAGLIGLTAAEVLKKSAGTLARPEYFSDHIQSVLEAREKSDSFEIQLADGRVITELDYLVRDRDGRFIGHLWVYEDVTHERQTAEQLIYLAERDPLTGLYNRHRFQNELSRMLVDCDRHGFRCSVMFFDLDEFKAINDNFGHHAGDALLMRVAVEVGSLMRGNGIFSRLGGDEFAILMPDARGEEAESMAEQVVRAVGRIPLRYDGRNLRVTASLGIAYYPQHAENAEEVVAKADMAMYQAKQAGKNTWRVFREDSESVRLTMERLTWNERIGRALDKGLLRLYVQGVYHARDKTLSHYEALVRMVDERDQNSLILPTSFIPVAEKSGRVVDIDRWMLDKTIRMLADKPDMPGVAVNISARSLSEPGLSLYIRELLQKHQVLPWRLMVELTETAAISDLQDAQRLIESLRQIGCGVCLDDFGTGFSSFAYLKHLHADTIKIDGMFIRDLHLDADNQVFVKAIVNIAQGMGKTVVAEYVESEKVLEMLNDFGIDLVQGYILGKPHEPV